MEAFHGRFYINGEFREKYIIVDQGKIKKIANELSGYDVTTLPHYVIPGGVDIHVHFRDPGETSKEDFRSGSLSAVFGGTTTVCDMPNNILPVTDRKSFEDKLSAISNKSYSDFSLYQTASSELIEQSIGQKIFLGKTTGGLLTDMEKSVWSDKLKVVHAELQSCLDSGDGKDTNLLTHDKLRPLECEMEAIENIFGQKLSKVHIAHLTSYRSLNFAKSLGFTTEVTPHHILLNNSMNLGSFGKVNPPLRKKSTQEELIMHLNGKEIDAVSSDHAPHSIPEKSEFEKAPSGIPGVETRLPLVLSLYKKDVISLRKAISLLAERPAEITQLSKGYISEGFDADFCILDFKDISKIDQEGLHSRVGWSPFDGYDSIFPQMVFLRGEPIVQEGELIASPSGRFINGKK